MRDMLFETKFYIEMLTEQRINIGYGLIYADEDEQIEIRKEYNACVEKLNFANAAYELYSFVEDLKTRTGIEFSVDSGIERTIMENMANMMTAEITEDDDLTEEDIRQMLDMIEW